MYDLDSGCIILPMARTIDGKSHPSFQRTNADVSDASQGGKRYRIPSSPIRYDYLDEEDSQRQVGPSRKLACSVA